jgi:hypothetical protein
VPFAHLALAVVGVPLAAAAAGWLVAGLVVPLGDPADSLAIAATARLHLARAWAGL